MGFLKRLFGKKDTKENTAQKPQERTKTTEKKDDPKAKEKTAQKPQEKTETTEKKDGSKAKDKHQKYHVSMNRDEKSDNFNMWRVRLEQSDKTIKHFRTQEEAIEYAEKLADDSGASVVIHKKDGSIRRQNYKKNS